VDYEPINRTTVYERDAWVCGICEEPVDPTLVYPDAWSASLDHVRPMNRQSLGSHTYANVQCSHLACNMAKSDAFTTV
jgi:hypothetical protein